MNSFIKAVKDVIQRADIGRCPDCKLSHSFEFDQLRTEFKAPGQETRKEELQRRINALPMEETNRLFLEYWNSK